MRYFLEEGVRIEKWKRGEIRCSSDRQPRPYSLDADEYEILKKCDGRTQIEQSNITDRLEVMRFIRREPFPESWDYSTFSSAFIEYPNCLAEPVDWTITDRCNYNCLHCFHAVDNNMLREEFSFEAALKFIDELRACGIRGVRLTGGEPTLYPHFREVVTALRERGIRLNTLVTNGAFLTPELLAFIRENHPRARLLISFDGIGWHDWMRQHKGSEEKTLKAIRMANEAGLKVDINSNVNRKNADVMFDSLKMLSELGIGWMRIIRTTEAPRWVLNQENNTLTPEEYYDFSCRFAEKYRDSGIPNKVIIWQSLMLIGRKKSFSCLGVKTSMERFSGQETICRAMFFKPSVQANGDLYPCAPFGGYNALHGVHLGNVFETPLQDLLSEGPFIDTICTTAEEKLARSEKCSACEFAYACRGGCPALATLSGGSIFSPDKYKCVLFQKGYYEKYCAIMDGWKNCMPL